MCRPPPSESVMSENRTDSPLFPPGQSSPRQPSGGAPDASPADREAYARAVREAGYPPIRGAPPEPSASPDVAPGPGYAPTQSGSAPPLGQPPAGYPLTDQPAGFAPPAGFVPPLDPQLYAHSLQVGGAVLPPDYLRRAPAGRIVLLAALGVVLLAHVGLVALYLVLFGADASVSQIIRLGVVVAVGAWLYNGSAWAYWSALIGLALGGLAGVIAGTAILDQGLVGAAVVGLGVIYGGAAAVLAFSPSVRDFLESQRLREYPGAGGSL